MVGAAAASGVLSIGGKSFSILEQAAILLQRAFEAMKETTELNNQTAEESRGNKEKEVMEVEPSVNQSKPVAMIEGPESSKQGEVRGNSGKTKGHAIEVCHATMYCDICASHDHVRLRCPKFKVVKLAAVPCGYTMEGLRFFHIPYESSQRQRSKAHTALISVFDGILTVPN
jgi:hypothetical protein